MDLKFKDKVVLITGASEGIGRALAKVFSREGAKIVISARNELRLNELAEEVKNDNNSVKIIKADVSKKDDCSNLISKTIAHFGKLDILVNNAGRTMWCQFDEIQDLMILKEIMETNFYGSVYCTYYALPYLYKTGGHIVAISSVAGLTGVPCRTIYSASKHAMVGFFDSLRVEVEPKGVHVTIVAPDFVKSEIHKRALKGDGSSLGQTPMVESKIMTAEECAELILKAILKKQRLLITSNRGKIGRWLKMFCPSLVDRIARKAIEQKH
ncbi:MAG TPA: SDR family oxidoreductase [Candidatus Hydrogenedens sp.]|nr:SDR family oxidoreductase [Candidatus Hydrogenedens sp.]HPP57634.1 SDR family oxidoreductase [Candidatus Hydrogenedens sp.]